MEQPVAFKMICPCGQPLDLACANTRAEQTMAYFGDCSCGCCFDLTIRYAEQPTQQP